MLQRFFPKKTSQTLSLTIDSIIYGRKSLDPHCRDNEKQGQTSYQLHSPQQFSDFYLDQVSHFEKLSKKFPIINVSIYVKEEGNQKNTEWYFTSLGDFKNFLIQKNLMESEQNRPRL